jgi:hypothetical protein
VASRVHGFRPKTLGGLELSKHSPRHINERPILLLYHTILLRCVGSGVKGKCALGPFLSILVIECQHKCFCANLCKGVDKMQIM